MAELRIVWVKSGIGYNQMQRKTLKALGLRRLNQVVTHRDSASTRGMINRVRHLVTVEEVSS